MARWGRGGDPNRDAALAQDGGEPIRANFARPLLSRPVARGKRAGELGRRGSRVVVATAARSVGRDACTRPWRA